MNLIESFQNLIAQVPEFVQPLIVALAGAVPFIEGEGASTIGVIAGIHPVISAISAIVGNFVCVTVLVLLAANARRAIANRARSRQLVSAGGTFESDAVGTAEGLVAEEGESARSAARKEKFQRAFVRYGVPGVSLLGPLLLPTQFTATMLAGIGIRTSRILFWQGVAIVGWTSVLTAIVYAALSSVL